MTRTELAANVAKKTDTSKGLTDKIIATALDEIATALENGEKVQFPGFGTFEVSERAERTGRNPQTGKEMVIPASKVPKFKPGKNLKERVNA